MKKLLLALGTAAAIATPVATVVACDATELNIEFPDKKGDYKININATIDDTKDGLKNLFTNILKEEIKETPKEMNDLKIQAVELYKGIASGEVTNLNEALNTAKKIVQTSIDMLWKYANLTETIKLNFTEPHTSVKTSGTSVVKGDATAKMKEVDGIKSITMDNKDDVIDQINHFERENATQFYASMLSALKDNEAVKAWAKSFPSHLKDGEIDWSQCVILEIENKTLTLASNWDDKSNALSEFIMKQLTSPVIA